MPWALEQAIVNARHGKWGDAVRVLDWAATERFYEHWYGIETAGIVSTRELGTDASVSNQYSPTSYRILHSVFARIAPRRFDERAAFLDIGCGKGRAVAVAASYPYLAVYGIDLSERLIAAAHANLTRARLKAQRWDVFVGDATAVALPNDVTAVFIYNSFRGAALACFMERLKESLGRAPRALTLVFVNPVDFDAAPYPWLRLEETLKAFQPTSPHADYGGERIEIHLYRTGRP